MKNQAEIVQFLEWQRSLLNVCRSEFARKCGTTPQVYNFWLRGKSTPKVVNLVAMENNKIKYLKFLRDKSNRLPETQKRDVNLDVFN